MEDMSGQHESADEHVAVLRPADVASFWREAAGWMVRAALLVVVAKVGLTLLLAVARGYGIRLELWLGFLPYLAFDVEQSTFERLVTTSTYFGAIGVAAALAWVAYTHRRRSEARARVGELDPEGPDGSGAPFAQPGEVEVYNDLVERAGGTGMWFGALLGSLSLLVTILFELVRHAFIDAYVWQQPHVLAIIVAGAPAVGLLAMWLYGRFDDPTPALAIVSLLPPATAAELGLPDGAGLTAAGGPVARREPPFDNPGRTPHP